jgi:hypothetical protein
MSAYDPIAYINGWRYFTIIRLFGPLGLFRVNFSRTAERFAESVLRR